MYVNVTAFGAKGDGTTDDTKAIQDAFDAAQKKIRSEQIPGSTYVITAPVVFFPSGKYLISDTINVAVNVQGEGTAILQQQNAAKDIFAGGYIWRWQLSGLTFVQGRHHLHIGNNNINTGRITIDKCVFQLAAGTAIRIREGSDSTVLSIRDCVFVDNDQALVNNCDRTTLSDSWISSSDKMKEKAVIENRHGHLVLRDICGVPGVTPDYDQRWIDNYGVLFAENVRFGGEGAGFTPVVNFAPYRYVYPIAPFPAITLDSCEVYACGNRKRFAAIFCEEVPNQIVVRNCHGLTDLPVIRVAEKLDLDTYFDNAERFANCLRFLVEQDNVVVSDANRDLPEQMRPYQANKIMADAKPKSGHWHRGTIVWNRNLEGVSTPQGYVKATVSAEKQPLGWLCVDSGKPGVWREVFGVFDKPIKTAKVPK